MALNFTTTRKAAQLGGVKTLVYSRAGVGKTTLCATAPNPVIISAESGLLALAKYDILAIEIKTVADLLDSYNWITSSNEARNYWTVCIDSVTEIAEVVLTKAKGVYKDPRQAYGELIDEMLKLIKKFRDLKGRHVYISAKEERIKDDATGKLIYGPGMPGQKLGPGLPYYFDEVFHLGIGYTQEGKTYRYLQTQPDFQYEAKDRSGALDSIERPDLNHVFNKIMEGVK
jgi:hypothetical protein